MLGEPRESSEAIAGGERGGARPLHDLSCRLGREVEHGCIGNVLAPVMIARVWPVVVGGLPECEVGLADAEATEGPDRVCACAAASGSSSSSSSNSTATTVARAVQRRRQ